MENSAIGIINIAVFFAVIYSVISIPAQIVRRIRRKRQGVPVSPMTLIIKKLLKYWLLTAVVLMPVSALATFLALESSGASAREIYIAIITKSLLGNIITSLLIGYVLMKSNKNNWSHSVLIESESKNS